MEGREEEVEKDREGGKGKQSKTTNTAEEISQKVEERRATKKLLENWLRKPHIEITLSWTGELIEQLKPMVVLPKSSIPSTHLATHNCL